MDASPPEVTGLKKRVNVAIRDAIGLSQNPPPICQDPDEAYTAIDSVARLVHGDLASMVIGGLASLFLQMLHPRAMAGVAQHSRYQDDPLGRMLQTANFIGATTYGSKSASTKSIKRVLQEVSSPSSVDPQFQFWSKVLELMNKFLGVVRNGRAT